MQTINLLILFGDNLLEGTYKGRPKVLAASLMVLEWRREINVPGKNHVASKDDLGNKASQKFLHTWHPI